ncbi:MAG: GDP-mannose 4,6-dehydratase [Chloroflexota bacterium]
MNDYWSARRVLVTGGAGFIGSHLVEALVAAGAQVTVLDTLVSGRAENLQRVAGQIRMLQVDMRTQLWPQLLEEPYDAIFHFAANAYVPPSVANPAWDYQINFESTFQLLEAMRALRYPGALIYASSAAVYGNPLRIPVSEDDATFPISPYGVSKLAAERYVAVYSRLYGLRAASLRLFSIYGPRQRKQVVYDLMERISQNRDELFIHGDGTQERDFGYVEDVARAAMIVAERGALEGEVYNVGSGQQCSIDWLARTLCRYMGASPRFKYSGAVRPGDPERLVVDISRICALGFRPQVLPEEGLRRTVEWFLQDRAALAELSAAAD